MSSQDRVRRYARIRRRKPVLDVDLNDIPPCEGRGQEGTSINSGSQDAQVVQPEAGPLPEAIDLEAVDDDVVISSPRAFAVAKRNSRRNQRQTVVVDVESEERASRGALASRNKRARGRGDEAIINCDLYINLEGNSNSRGNRANNAPPPPPPPPPTFSCPICMGPLVEEVTTKCGHIFCKACIKAAIAAQNKCPTCRRRTTVKDIIRVYLPAANS